MHARRSEIGDRSGPIDSAAGLVGPRLGILSGRIVGAQNAEPVYVLVVEPGESARRALVAMLRAQGYEVTPAGLPVEAAAWLAQRQFHVVICTIAPGVEGASNLVEEIAEQYPEAAVLIAADSRDAALARDVARRRGLELVSSPCAQGELSMLMERALTRRSLQQRHAQRYKIALDTSHESVLDALLSALNARNTEAAGHTERVTAYTMDLADRLGLAAAQTYHIERGALLHDIGKVGISERVLRKQGKLTPEEWAEIRKHTVIGHEMCSRIEPLRPAAAIVRHHHERWDGQGYPDGLAGEAIPIGARIFAVADALDAMTMDRPYRAAMSLSEARDEIVKNAGKQFDPVVVSAFESVPAGRWLFVRTNAAR